MVLLVLVLSAATMVWLVQQHAENSSSPERFSILNLVIGGDAKASQLATVMTASILAIVLIPLATLALKALFGRWLAPVARLAADAGFYLVLAVFALEYFDDGKEKVHSVENLEDLYSSIPLVAHTEYWQTELVWDHLYTEVAALLP